MQMKWRVWTMAGIPLVLGISFPFRDHGAAQKKNVVWQPVLPKQEYNELIARALKSIQKDIKGINRPTGRELERRMRKLQATGLLIAAVAQSNGAIAKDRKLATLRDAALKFTVATRAGDAGMVIKAAGAFPVQKADPAAKLVALELRKFSADPEVMMQPMKRMALGGDGLDPALQDNPRLRGPANGIEDKILALTSKKLPAAQMKKQARELVLLGYKLAAMAQLVDDWTPNIENQGARKEWARLSEQMRKSALELAAAAKKGNAQALQNAARKLNSHCNQCHR